MRLIGSSFIGKLIGCSRSTKAQPVTMGSLFDGIGAFPAVAERLGIKPVWASEIIPACVGITKQHFPDMQHLGDITKLDGAKMEPVDIIAFGSPCQDLSIAGKRGGLSGDRSSLFGEAIRIIREMRVATHGKYPRFAIWENVPGALSSNKRMDFQSVLKAFTESDIPIPKSGRWANAGMARSSRCEVAWRVLDAQYFGVPQRRRRIFLVADFGGQRAGEILFKPDCDKGDIPQSSGQRQDSAGNAGEGVGGTNYLNGWDCQRYRIVDTDGICPTLDASDGGGAHGALVFCVADTQSNASIGVEVAPTLTAMHEQPYVAISPVYVCRTDQTGSNGLGVTEDIAYTLDSTNGQAVCTLDCRNLVTSSVVRRLTPRECERLMGLPDDWTATTLTEAGKVKNVSDAERYRVIGNSIALPCAEYVLSGMREVIQGD